MARMLTALTIRQPWCHAILHLGKDVENRSWPTQYRGPLLIHAGASRSRAEYAGFQNMLADPECAALLRSRCVDPVCPAFEDLPRAGFVGMADLVDCVGDSDSPWWAGPGQFAFVLANPRPIPFVPFKGRLGLFRVAEDEVLR